MGNGAKLTFTSVQENLRNARAKRSIRTIITNVKQLLPQSHPALAVANTKNNIHSKNAGYLSKFQVKILLKNFIPFSTRANVWQQTVNKLEPRAIRSTLLGVDPTCYDQFATVKPDVLDPAGILHLCRR